VSESETGPILFRLVDKHSLRPFQKPSWRRSIRTVRRGNGLLPKLNAVRSVHRGVSFRVALDVGSRHVLNGARWTSPFSIKCVPACHRIA
jgi:hypothetical protein